MGKLIRIGVFIPNDAQALDVATVDVLGILSKEYLGVIPIVPKAVAASAPSVRIDYITTPAVMGKEGSGHIPLTSNMSLKATHAYDDEDVAPGKLDIVIVPGPDMAVTVEEGARRWLREQSLARRQGHDGEEDGAMVDVLCVCTGIYVCGQAGILEGRMASGPKGLQDDIVKRFEGVKLVGDQHRWVQDGNFWSSGGVTNGNDLMAAYARASPLWADKGIVEMGLGLADVGDRKQMYE